MVTNLTIKTYVDGENDIDFTNGKNTNPIEVGEFTYTAQRMGAVPNIVATIYDFECLDSLWNKKQYVEYNSEKYFVYNTPTSYKDNEDGRYKHTVTFLSERHELNGIFFFDVIGGEYTSSFFSNSTEVYFYGDLVEFASRLQASIIASGVNYTVEVDKVGEGEDAEYIETEATMVSFEDTYTLDALQEAYELYGIPYYFSGREIHFGYAMNDVTETFEYGGGEKETNGVLLSVTKTNAAEKVVTYCTGTGSEDNIPYYYPNTSDYASDKLTIPYEIEEALNNTCAELGIEVTLYDSTPLNLGATSYIYLTNKNVSSGNDNSQTATLWNGSIDYVADAPIIVTIPLLYLESDNYSQTEWARIYLFKHSSGTDSLAGLTMVERYLTPDDIGDDIVLTYQPTADDGTAGYSVKVIRYLRGTAGSYGLTDITLDVGSVIQDGGSSTKYTFSIDDVVEYIEDTLIPNNPTYSTELNALLEWTIGKIADYTSTSDSMATSTYLMPSIFRSSGATERFYGAQNYDPDVENSGYLLPDGSGDYYEFENVYEDAVIKEQVKIDFEDIKPTIVGITNTDGDLIATVTQFAYDDNDDDSFETENGEVSTTYAHPYFYAKLKPTDGTYGFNLFESHIDEDPMVLTLTSGSLQGTDFEVQAVEDSTTVNGVTYQTFWNPVYTDSNGKLLAGDYRDKMAENANSVDKNRALPQQDTRNGEVWIALKKSENNFGVILPNATNSYYPEAESSFVLTHISLPQAYITAAEKRLEDAIIAYMYDNNVEKYNFTIKFSRVYLAENPSLVEQLNENSVLSIRYDNKLITSYISTYTYKRSASESLPEITVTLSDTIGVTSGALQNAISEVSATVTGLIPSSADFLKAALPYFLRKDVSDTAQQPLYFSNGAYSSDFRQGFFAGSGWGIYQDNDGNTVGEFDQIIVRQTATFNELVINQISFTLGQTVFTNGGFEVTGVEDDELWYRCYYDNEEGKRYAGIVVGDFVRCQEYDSSYDSVTRFYSRLVVAIGDDYVDLSKEVFNGVGAPQIGDNCVQWGNYEDESRQYAIIRNVTGGGYDQFLWGINTVSSVGTEYYFVGQNSAEDPRMQFGNEAIGGIRAVLGKEDDGITPKVDVDIWANSFAVKSPTGEWEDVSESVLQAQQDAADAIAGVDAINSDGIFSINEKLVMRTEWEQISGRADVDHTPSEAGSTGSYMIAVTAAESAGIDTTDLTAAYQALLDLFGTDLLRTEEREYLLVEDGDIVVVEDNGVVVTDMVDVDVYGLALYVDENTAFTRSELSDALSAYYNAENAIEDGYVYSSVNLLDNSVGKFQPSGSRLDNYEYYSSTTIAMEYGEIYTVAGSTNGIFTNIHNNLTESNNCVLWLSGTSGGDTIHTIISGSATGTTGTTFKWEYDSGTYTLRVNSYVIDNSVYAEKIIIIKGNKIDGSWSPSVNDQVTNLGYDSWDDMVAKAATGETIIKGGYINTELIEAEAIKADMIDVTDLTVKNVEATNAAGTTTVSIVGSTGKLTATGATISGHIEATSGSFAGDLDAVSGTFGTLRGANTSFSLAFTEAGLIISGAGVIPEGDSYFRGATFNGAVGTLKNNYIVVTNDGRMAQYYSNERYLGYNYLVSESLSPLDSSFLNTSGGIIQLQPGSILSGTNVEITCDEIFNYVIFLARYSNFVYVFQNLPMCRVTAVNLSGNNLEHRRTGTQSTMADSRIFDLFNTNNLKGTSYGYNDGYDWRLINIT